MTEEEKLLTTKEVAQMLRVTERTIINYARNGEIPAIKIGFTRRYWRFSKLSIEEYIKQREGETS